MMETIEDIVNKMLEAAKKSPFVNSLDLVFFATHITAAYHESAQYQAGLLDEYRAENARLKAVASGLYECLAQAVSFVSDNAEFLGSDCATASFVGKCRRVLAKASGEEVEQ